MMKVGRKPSLNIHWKDWCWSWSSNTLAKWCKELTHWNRSWCWEKLKAAEKGDNRGWDGWMESLTRWTWVWVNSGVGDGQGGLACCDSWGHKESDTTEWLNWDWYWVAQLCPTLCDPMDCNTPGFPVHHQLLELAQTHIYWASDAIQPSHSLSSPSPPALNLSQHQSLFQLVSSSHQVAKVLEFQL